MEILVRCIEIFNQYNEKITYALEKAGIIYVKDLKCITIEEIKNMKGVGAKLIKELEEKCKELRIVLKDPEEERQKISAEISKKQEQLKTLERIIEKERKIIRDLEEKLVIATQENQGKDRI